MDNSIKKVNIKQKNSILKKITSTKINLIISIMLTILLLTICIIAPYISPYDPNLQDLSISLMPPNSEHLFGTDKFGRDLFSRVLCGGAPSILGSVAIVFIVTVIGVFIGVLGGYFGGKIDSFSSISRNGLSSSCSWNVREWSFKCDNSTFYSEMDKICSSCEK